MHGQMAHVATHCASYYCSSVGQFYPNTSYCPEGWQLVTVR